MFVRLLPLALIALSACTLHPKNSDGGGGSGGGEAGGDTGGQTEGGSDQGAGGAGESPCSAITDCETCRACAANDPCEAAFDACLANPVCVAIDECLAFCGATPSECWETCRAQNAPGVDEYDAARGCMDCVVCEDSCATASVCGE